MDPKDIGLCALLIGIEKVAQSLNKSPSIVEAYISLVKFENTPFLLKITNVLKEIIETHGICETKKVFKLDDDILNFISSCDFTEKVQFSTEDSELKTRVLSLYNKNIPIKRIQALFDLPNTEIIQTWGEWRRFNNVTAGENKKKLKEQYEKSLESGMSLEDTALFYGITPQKLEFELGKIKRKKIFFDTKSICEILTEFERTKSEEFIINEYGCSKECLVSWFNNYHDDRPFNFKRCVESDEEADSVMKRNAIEEVYNRKDVQSVANGLRLNEKIVAKWISVFEDKVTKTYATKKKKEEKLGDF